LTWKHKDRALPRQEKGYRDCRHTRGRVLIDPREAGRLKLVHTGTHSDREHESVDQPVLARERENSLPVVSRDETIAAAGASSLGTHGRM